MPVENSGNVACFTFNASFNRNVPTEFVEKPLQTQTPYLLLVRLVQSVKEAMHHPADLDLVKIMAEVKNVSIEASQPITKRLFFNKELLYLGNLEVRTGDELKISFSIQRFSSDGNTVTVPFSETDYIVTEEGLVPSVVANGEP